VNTDESVRRLGKGAERPLNRMEDRAALLAALACVTLVTSFHEDTPEALIAQLKPDLIVKGGDYDMEKLPETALVKTWGGRAVAIPFEFERSTTALVRKIQGGA
jgi:rfaE bifunctional protein nucleotidyltransferase chain/domain